MFSKFFKLAVIVFLVGIAAPVLAQSPVGTWKTVDDNTGEAKSYVTIYEQGGMLFAKVSKLLLDPEDSLCDKCPGNKKNKPIKGMVIMWDMEKDGSEWSDGRILDPENGEDYSCKIWFEDNNYNKLYVRGYWGFFYRTQNWHRVK